MGCVKKKTKKTELKLRVRGILYVQVWAWKQPGFPNICSTVASSLSADVIAENDWTNIPGYFEAGSVFPCCMLLWLEGWLTFNFVLYLEGHGYRKMFSI